MRKSWIISTIAIGMAVAGSAGASPSSTLVIRPGVSIGKIRLGMTIPEATRVLGRARIVGRRETRGFGIRYVEFQWNYASWRIGFRGRAGEERAVRIGTTLRSERTPAGIGVGSNTKDMVRRYGGRISCVVRPTRPDAGAWLVLRGPSSNMTAFWLTKANGRGYKPRIPPMVGEVLIQRAWASGGTALCPADWRSWRW